MKKMPWMKFSTADWRSDPRLRMCGLASRGLWMEMIALLHEADPYGHLLVTGKPPTDTQLAMLAGAPSEQIPELLGELESAGVFSRTGKGVIYSRRMTRDEKKRTTARKNGKSGGNPNLCSSGGKTPSDNPRDNPRVKGGLKPKRLEAREQSSVSSLHSDTGDPPLSEIIFGQGLKFLCKSGVLEKSARSILGKWRKVHGDERLLAALGKAQREGALDPVAFCEGVFRHVNGAPPARPTASDHIMAEIRAAEEAKAAEGER